MRSICPFLIYYVYSCILHISVGFLISTVVRLYGFFWLLYLCDLSLKILYPLKSAILFKSDYKRVVYSAEILIAIIIATVPSIVSVVLSNYNITRFPPVQCGHSDDTYHIYSLAIVALTTVCVSGVLMSLTLYKIHMVSLM